MTPPDALAAAARALVGTPFRPGGRDPATGLDCFGLLHAALVAIGIQPSLPATHRQRKLALPDLDPWLVAHRLVIAQAPAIAGDVMLLRCGPAQPHCAILTLTGFVHAHAGLRRVVEAPGMPPYPLLSHARLDTRRGTD
ncbi:MAG: hypothetical protein COW16_08450 [Sphingomonadales bacterium CG12_big_fil_rev_8_21_14_0_65_65_10]|nr:MAG: hypothetical protein COW16_08450 [Sphingomonadales bacterium CG12_big_fil_rev_8_21_14_0_65_65_10]